jgi:hypothetical protein
LVLLGSALLAWLAQFHRLADFGFYEDDYFHISSAMGQDGAYLLERLRVALTLPQGRPLAFFVSNLMGLLGDKMAGLVGIYLLGFAFVTLNTLLCYRLLRLRVPPVAALAGAAMLGLFPADTTKILLTHDFQLQQSLTFVLLAALAYAANHRWLTYVLAVAAFFAYESGFLALFALPMFLKPWSRSLPRELVRNGLILLGIVLAMVVARLLVGEQRAVESASSMADVVARLAWSLVLGPAYSLAASVYQPLRTVPQWDVEALVCSGMALVAFAALFWRMRSSISRWRDVLELSATGIVMIVVGYGFAFTHFPPTALVGRGTSVHLGATLGIAILVAALAWGLLAVQPRLGAVVLAAYMALAVGYYVTIQRDFALSWQLQRAFWQQVVACCSDVQDGTLLLFEADQNPPTRFIATNSWADPLVLRQTYRYPDTWQNPPRLFTIEDWRSLVVSDGGRLLWWVPGASWDEHWEELPQGNVILLRRAQNGLLERVSGSAEVAGQTLRLKQAGPGATFPPGQLYQLLLK